jgi:hypothetical protein
MESLFQENDQVGRDGVPLLREGSGGQIWSPSSMRIIRWAEMEPLYKKNEEACRDGDPLPRENNQVVVVGAEKEYSSLGMTRWNVSRKGGPWHQTKSCVGNCWPGCQKLSKTRLACMAASVAIDM